jgi:ADP-ribosyl-[dinitrogen reductase] hydrolase
MHLGPWSRSRSEPVGSNGIDSVHAAIQAIVMHDKLSAILRQCIDFKGDVDTVATIALGAASLSADIIQDLPRHLFDGLEDGEWGISYLMRLDVRLAQFLTRAGHGG